MLRALDDEKEVIVVLLDLSVTFDTIDHEILVARLHTQFGFTGKVLQWFISCLQDRCQRVVITRAGRHRVEVLAPFFLVVFFSGHTCSPHALCEC